MKWLRFIAVLGTLAMAVVILWAALSINFFEAGAELMANPWGVVSLVDLYVGFIIFSAWIAYRETSLLVKIIWTVLMMVFGFLTASIYLLFVIRQSQGDWQRFFHGARVTEKG